MTSPSFRLLCLVGSKVNCPCKTSTERHNQIEHVYVQAGNPIWIRGIVGERKCVEGTAIWNDAIRELDQLVANARTCHRSNCGSRHLASSEVYYSYSEYVSAIITLRVPHTAWACALLYRPKVLTCGFRKRTSQALRLAKSHQSCRTAKSPLWIFLDRSSILFLDRNSSCCDRRQILSCCDEHCEG